MNALKCIEVVLHSGCSGSHVNFVTVQKKGEKVISLGSFQKERDAGGLEVSNYYQKAGLKPTLTSRWAFLSLFTMFLPLQ